MAGRKTIKVPEALWYGIREFAKREKIPMWQVVQRAWGYWLGAYRNHHVGHSDIDRIAWYIFKVSSSVGEFKAMPNEENYNRLLKTLVQLNERLGVEIDLVVECMKRYLNKPNLKNRMALNDATKALVIQILTR